MKQNRYFIHSKGFSVPVIFGMYSYRTKTLSFYDSSTKKFGYEDLKWTIEIAVDFVKRGDWKEISYKEAMDLKDYSPVKFCKPTNTPRYFTHVKGFECDIVFIKCDNETACGRSYYKDGKYESSFSLTYCLYNVENKVWKEITKDEAEAMITPVKKDIIYYNHVKGFLPREQFVSYDPNTNITKIHNKNGEINCSEFSLYSYETCEELVKEGTWKHITKDEAYALLQPEKDDEIEYYKHKEMFADGTLFLEYNKTQNKCYACNTQMKTEKFHLSQYIDINVKAGNYIKITRVEAYQLLYPVKKDDEDAGDILSDTYAIRCFFNGERKFTDKLTQKEAYVFRKAAANLYSYLTKEYKLSLPKKG